MTGIPHNWAMLISSSYARLTNGDVNGAEQLLAPSLSTAQQRPPKAVLLLGLIKRVQGKAEEAEKLLLEAARGAPADPEAHQNLANLYTVQGRHAEAESAFRAALFGAPTNNVVRLGLARALNSQGKFQLARDMVGQCLGAKRGTEELRVLAHALGGMGQHAPALEALEELLRAAPTDKGARFDRAVALRKLKRREEAATELERLVADGLGDANLLLTLGLVYVEIGDVDRAADVFEHGIQKYPDDPPLQRERAHLGWMRGLELDDAGRKLSEAIARNPGSVDLRLAFSSFLSRGGEFERAEVCIRDGLHIVPDNAMLLSALGGVLDEQDKPEAGLVPLRAAAAMRKSREVVRQLVQNLLRANHPAEALRVANDALADNPFDQIWLTQKTTALRMLGDGEFVRLCDMNRFVQEIELPPPADRSSEEYNSQLAARLDSLHVLEQHPLIQTLRNGTQTPRDLTEVEDDVIQAFLASVRAAVSAFAVSLPHDPTHPFLNRNPKGVEFAGSWSVRLKPGGNHFNHVHPMGWISSAYYVRLPKREPDDPPHAGWIKFGEPRLPIPGCTPLKWVEPKVGRLVLFPSYMWHGTEPFFRDDRLTCAFDFVPS